MSAPDFELPPVEAPFEIPSLDPQAHSSGDAIAQDGGILIYPAAGADQPPTYIPESVLDGERELTSAVANLIPVLGETKGLIEAFTGEDLITGRELAWWERALNVAVVIPVPEVAEAGHVLKLIHEIHLGADVVHTVVHAKHLEDVIRGEH